MKKKNPENIALDLVKKSFENKDLFAANIGVPYGDVSCESLGEESPGIYKISVNPQYGHGKLEYTVDTKNKEIIESFWRGKDVEHNTPSEFQEFIENKWEDKLKNAKYEFGKDVFFVYEKDGEEKYMIGGDISMVQRLAETLLGKEEGFGPMKYAGMVSFDESGKPVLEEIDITKYKPKTIQLTEKGRKELKKLQKKRKNSKNN